jgi:hypothetical protein
MKRYIFSIGTGIMILFLFNITHATVWYVHPDSTLNRIQNALNGCSTGDTVLVGPGTYVENIVWPNTQGIHLTSELGPDITIIDGDSVGRVINISAGIDTTTVIRGFTIRNGYVVNLDGGGILCDGASPRIVSSVFTANSAYGSYNGGGAIACEYNAPAVIDSNTMYSNYGTWGGAIMLWDSSGVAITNNYIHDNSADTCAGGIACWSYCSPIIKGNTITNNLAGWAGGIWICQYSAPVVMDNTITGNMAEVMGGGIYNSWYSSPTIIHNTITGNTSFTGQYGGGVRYSPTTSGILKHCIISNNDGAGISVRQATPDIDSCDIEYNTYHGVYNQDGANPTVNWCNIVDNELYGIFSENTSVTIDAENNWWGHSTGPYHSSNPGGLGDTVSDYVDFDPWLAQPVIGLHEQSRPVVKHTLVQTTIVRGVLNLQSAIYNLKSEITLLDVTGRKVMDLQAGANDIRRLSPGIYFVRQKENNQTTKVVIMR